MYLFTLNIYSNVYYTWFEFIQKEFNLNLSIDNIFQECFNLQKESNIYNAIFSDKLCIVSDEQSYTYKDLDKISNQIAHFLLESKVQPGECVAVVVDRKAITIANILGILPSNLGWRLFFLLFLIFVLL